MHPFPTSAHESCTFDVKEEKAPCGYIFSSYSDYENVTWKCIETPTTTTTSTITTTTSMFDLNINTNIDGVTKKAFEKGKMVAKLKLIIKGLIFVFKSVFYLF